MTLSDFLQRFIFDKAPVRGEYIHLHTSFQTIVNQHQYPPPVKKLLGETLCIAGLLSAIIKFKGRLTVQFRGKGRLKMLLAQCDNNFHLRGLAKFEEGVSYDDLMTSFQDGTLAIMLDSGIKNQRYQGIVAWKGNSLVESIEGYFADSEQLATKITLAVNETTAVGFLLQVLPGADKEATGIYKEVIEPHWEHIMRQTSQLKPDDLLNLHYSKLLLKIFSGEDIRIFDEVPVSFQCTCSRKRGEEAIYILGREEAEAELKAHQTLVVTCDFCNKEYVYDRIDVAKVFEDGSDLPPPSSPLH